MTRIWRTLAALLLASVLLVSCGNDSDSASIDDAGGGADVAEESGGRAGEGADQAKSAAPEGQPADERDIIYTANALVRVDDVEDASAEATEIAEGAGGFLAGQDATLEGQREATLTLRVPSSEFRPVLDAVTALGEVRDRSITSDDVTDQVVDVQGRLESQQASADRLRALLADAPDTQAIVVIEAELSQRESEIESLQGRLRVLEDQSALATIDVTYSEDVEVPAEDDDDPPGFVGALKAGVATLANLGRVVLVVVGFLLPFVPLFIGGWFLVRWLMRRRASTPTERGPEPDAAGLPPFPRAPAPSRPNPPDAASSPPGDER